MGRFLLKELITAMAIVEVKDSPRLPVSPSAAYILEVMQLKRNGQGSGPLGRTLDLHLHTLLAAAQEASLTLSLSDEHYAQVERFLLNSLEVRSVWCLGVAADVADLSSADKRK